MASSDFIQVFVNLYLMTPLCRNNLLNPYYNSEMLEINLWYNPAFPCLKNVFSSPL